MCYSVESSFKTTCISLFAIIYLLRSNIPHFQWIAIGLIGWCGMQFAELLLWLTDPRKGCTIWNKIITLTLIPLILVLQPLGFLWGSLYETSWNKSSDIRKKIMIFYSIFIILVVSSCFYYKPYKICTTVSESGYLYWQTSKYGYTISDISFYFVWALLILLPLIVFWRKHYTVILLVLLIPTFGFFTGLKTDSRGSIWCYYTSYSSIISIILLVLNQMQVFPLTF